MGEDLFEALKTSIKQAGKYLRGKEKRSQGRIARWNLDFQRQALKVEREFESEEEVKPFLSTSKVEWLGVKWAVANVEIVWIKPKGYSRPETRGDDLLRWYEYLPTRYRVTLKRRGGDLSGVADDLEKRSRREGGSSLKGHICRRKSIRHSERE